MNKWLKSTETILFDVSDGVAVITLNRPEKRNAISNLMQDELAQAMLEADDRLDVNVIVLKAAGKDFCSGYDLAGVYGGKKETQGGEPEFDPTLYRSMMSTFDDDAWSLERALEKRLRIFDIHKPVIAQVQGNCLAGGCDLAFMCDIVIAADDARIGFPATRGGGTPPTQFWLYHLGPQWAKRLLFAGDSLSGADAAKLGMVLEAAPADQLDDVVMTLARRIAITDSELLACQKRVINLGLELMHARTLQRLVAETDARAHISQGPRRKQWREDMNTVGLKAALKNRDEPFGDDTIKLNK